VTVCAATPGRPGTNPKPPSSGKPAGDAAASALSDAAVADRLNAAASIHLATLRRNSRGRLDPRVIDGATGVYNQLRKTYFATGRPAGFVTIFELAQALYPGIYNGADSRRKAIAIRRHLRRLQAAGVARVTVQTTEGGQNLGLWWELAADEPQPASWPDLRDYSRPRYPERAAAAAAGELPTVAVELHDRRELPCAHPRRRVHKFNRRIGRGAERRYDVARAWLSPTVAPASEPRRGEGAAIGTPEKLSETFGATTSPPRPYGARGAVKVGERRARATSEPEPSCRATSADRDHDRRDPAEGAEPRPWAALSRCRTAASSGGALAVLSVPRAGWPAMAAAAFEATFVSEADGSWWTLGDPHHAERPRELTARAAGRLDPAVLANLHAIDADPELAAPEHRHRYITLSAAWARRLEVWCRTYDRAVKQPGAGIRSLVEDVASWQPADGAPGADPIPGVRRRRSTAGPDAGGGWPVSLAFFVARLGRRAKIERAQHEPERRTNMRDWSEGERW
jgi:hypothetical protein